MPVTKQLNFLELICFTFKILIHEYVRNCQSIFLFLFLVHWQALKSWTGRQGVALLRFLTKAKQYVVFECGVEGLIRKEHCFASYSFYFFSNGVA
jgi:hypothetical protein